MQEAIIYKQDGRITNSPVVKKFFDELADGKYLLSAKNIKRRSLQQNAYLHGVVIPLVYEGLRNAGFNEVRDFEDAKEVIKSLFLKQKIVNQSTGEIITEIVKHTHKLTTSEMMAFIDEVVMWAATYLSITIPMPNEQVAIFSE